MTGKMYRLGRVGLRMVDAIEALGPAASDEELSAYMDVSPHEVRRTMARLREQRILMVRESSDRSRYVRCLVSRDSLGETPLARRRRERSQGLTTRACLSCGKEFQSEGAHNRMCRICRKNTQAAAYQVFGRSWR